MSTVTPDGVVLYQGPAHTPEWFTARAGGVTASEIAAIVGLSPWESRFSLYHRKAGAIPPQQQTPRMTAGLLLEDAIRGWWSQDTGQPILATNVVLAHRERAWQKASPDALTMNATVEAKTVSWGDEWHWGEPGTDQVPPYYRVQGMWQMDTTGLRSTWFPVLFSNFRFEWYRVDYDPADAAWLRDQARRFLDDLETGNLPDLDGHTATYQAARQLHPAIDGTDVEIPVDIADRYRLAKLDLRNAQLEDSHASALVLTAMGDARRAMCQGDYIARREARPGKPPYLKCAIRLNPAQETAA